MPALPTGSRGKSGLLSRVMTEKQLLFFGSTLLDKIQR